MPFDHFVSSTTILSLCGLLLGAGLIYSRLVDVPTALMLMVGSAIAFCLRDSITGKQLMYAIPVLAILGLAFWGISKLPKRQRRFSYRLIIVLLIGLFCYALYCYIEVLSMILLFGGLIVLLLAALFMV